MSETTETKEPLALLVKGRQPEEIVAWACGTCGIVARTEEDARRCCDRRCDCGAPTPRPYTSCDACRKKEWTAREEKRLAADQAALEAAPKVAYAGYDGKYLYSERLDGGGGGEGYFPEVSDLLDRCAEDGIDPPTLVWACSPRKMGLDADDLISNACDEMYEDAAGDVSDAARKSLQKALDVWCERHSPTSYVPRHDLAVDISAEVAVWNAEQEGEAVASRAP